MAIATALLAILFAFSPLLTSPASADPPDEGGTDKLWKTLEESSRGYYEIKDKLEKSRARQGELNGQIAESQTKVDELSAKVDVIAEQAYVDGPVMELSAAMDSKSFTQLMERMVFLDQLNWQNGKVLGELKTSKAELDRQKEEVDAEIAEEERQEQELLETKQEAERALAEVGGAPSGGYSSGGLPAASPGPGGGGGCTEDDPTTSGCLTPNTLHALYEAKEVGFTRYVACHRAASYGEHPKGRACDFAAAQGGFEGAATGDDRLYGNRLAGWFVENAETLGVLYVIWYKQIWMPGTGWRSYSGGGDPSSAHTNHVHLSME
ncbi:MAG: hypothetical protein HOQ05_05440 [Corynebacteriales bacterium]|nr:hypothetical protein [Mycobacteriales bacterium]